MSIFTMLATGLTLLAAAQATKTPSCCDLLANAGLDERILRPDTTPYNNRVDSYFSKFARLSPDCFVQPESAEEVAKAVKALVDGSKDCKFAIRSGGHAMWEGAGNIENGVTIDLGKLTTTTYHKEKGTASVSPGSSWQSVYESLATDDVAVMGGRTGTVGVGGLVLGGGLSMFSARKGFVCDSVKEFEVVLANGDIVVANEKQNADLWKALKGGSGNFGIVTRYELEAFPAEAVWGGLVLWDHSQTEDFIEASVQFVESIEKDPYSTAFQMWMYRPDLFSDIMILSGMHNTRGERPASFEPFFDLNVLQNSTRLAPLTDFGPELELPPNEWNIWLTATFKNDGRVMKKATNQHADFVEKMKKLAGPDGFSTSCEFQPFPKQISSHSAAKGGNMLGLEKKENMQLFTAHLSFKDGSLSKKARELVTKEWFDPVVQYSKKLGLHDEFVYLNYADRTQNPLAGYGKESLKVMKKVAKKYDPEGVFQKRTPGGFKISKA